MIFANLIDHSLPEKWHVGLGEGEPRPPGEVLREFAGEHPAVRSVHLLGDLLGYNLLPPGQVELGLLLSFMFLAQIVREPSQGSLNSNNSSGGNNAN